MSPDNNRRVEGLISAVSICFFFSGALGLTYQILWLRKLLLIFGSTVHAVSTVLTVFFAGLALGSWIFGRWSDRYPEAGLRAYGLLEAAVGVYALFTLPLFDVLQGWYIPLYRNSGLNSSVLVGFSFLGALLVLLLPATLLGGTFPVLTRFMIRTARERGELIAKLYGINTAGAMLGTLSVYFLFLPVLGLQRTLLCAAALNIGLGLLCVVFDRHLGDLGFRLKAQQGAAPASSAGSPLPIGALLTAFGLSGFSAMVYEVGWTRLLSLVLGSSIYAFCVMLTTFLGGMALGSLVIRHDLEERPATVERVMRLEFLLGVYGILSLPFFNELPNIFVTLWPMAGNSFGSLLILQWLLCGVAMFLPTLMMGLLFPLVGELITRHLATLGSRLGSAYAINTIGGIAGSFLSGFLLIPLFGLPWTIAIAGLVNLLAAGLLYNRIDLRRPTIVRFGIPLLVVWASAFFAHQVVIPSWRREMMTSGVYLNPGSYSSGRVAEESASDAKIVFYRDSLNATVSVHQNEKSIFLKVGGKTDASTGLDMGTQVLSAHLPLLMHPNPKDILVIGLGSGVTLGNAGRHPVDKLDCAELDPAVVEGARFFKNENYAVHDDARTRMFVADGRNYLLAAPDKYDVIISEPSNPWMAGLATLFTTQYYQLAKARLKPGGLMCQWLQLYRIFPEDVKLMLKTFHSEFPHVTVWSPIPGDMLLIGSLQPQQIDYAALSERMQQPEIKEALEKIQLTHPRVLLELFWMGNREVEWLSADTPWAHEDDLLTLEFNAPKSLYASEVFLQNYNGLRASRGPVESISPGAANIALDGAYYSALADYMTFRNESKKVQEALDQALTLQPDSVTLRRRLAENALKLGYAASGAKELQAVLQRDATDVEAHKLLARLHWKEQRHEEAYLAYRELEKLQAPDGELAREIGDCLAVAANLREDKSSPETVALWGLAAEHYRSALSQLSAVPARFLAAYVAALKPLKDWASIEGLLRLGKERFPNDAGILVNLAEALIEQNRWDESAPVLQEAMKRDARRADAYFLLARIAQQRQSREAARSALLEGLRIDPYHAESLQRLRSLDQSASMDGGTHVGKNH